MVMSCYEMEYALEDVKICPKEGVVSVMLQKRIY